ncbi:MAG: hypothetical protein K0S81_3752, partial [Rhodospirillales bacterium]|nr:hypothetical protein [Rhodospirillales bacterium]
MAGPAARGTRIGAFALALILGCAPAGLAQQSTPSAPDAPTVEDIAAIQAELAELRAEKADIQAAMADAEERAGVTRS